MNTNEQTIHQMGLGISSLVKQATGRESVSNIDMDWVSVEQLARYIYGSGSGDVVSFNTNIPDAIESLIAYITAVQDLHGYDNPWPLGGGVNKSLYTVESIKSATGGTWTGNSTTINDIEFTILTDADNNVTGINVNGTSTGTAVLNLYDTSVNPFTENVKYRVNGLWADGSAETFKHDIIYNTSSIAVVDMSVNAGSNFTVSADIAAATRIRERLVIYSGITLDNVKFYPMISVYADTVPDFVPPSNICYITGWTGCTITDANMLDSSDPDYYADTYTFTFPDEAGTVYGVTLDVLSGVLTVDKAIINVADVETINSYGTGSAKYYYFNVSDVKKAASTSATPNMISNQYAAITPAQATGSGDYKGISAGVNVSQIFIKDTNIADVTALKAQGITIVYELAEPVTYQLTAQEVTALIGQNNIFANTGNVSVQYKVKEDLV